MTEAATTDPAIEMHGVGKCYQVMQQQAMLLRSLLPFARPTRRDHWALRDVDLRVDRGETVGVIGRNGAGKTTMLRMLAGVTQPSEGRLRVAGTIAPLIGIGVGFHNEMTGRENVHVNGMLLGLSRSEVEARFDDIAAFAQLDGFLDTPVKFYSSGMFLRLGFSVAIHVEPDVLLVDEVLAVGDAAFQRRCFERMRRLQEGGTTVVMVSHNLMAVRLLCPRAVVLRRGRLEFDGPAEEAIGTHHRLMDAEGAADPGDAPLVERPSAGVVRVTDQQLVRDGRVASAAGSHDPVELVATLHFDETVVSPQLVFLVHAEDGTLLYRSQSAFGSGERSFAAGSAAHVQVPFEPRLGGGGTYRLQLLVADREGTQVLGRSPAPTSLYVNPRLGVLGVADLDARLLLDGEPIDDHPDLTMGAAAPGAGRDHGEPGR